MSNKRLYITLGIMFISLTINGCQTNNGSSIVPAFSDSAIEIEIPEPEPIEEPDNNLVDNAKLEQELNEVEDQKIEDTSNFSGGAVDYSNEPWYVEGIDYSRDNNGQGWDLGGKHYNTKGEYMKAFYEASMSDPDNLTQEELETLGNGGTVTFD